MKKILIVPLNRYCNTHNEARFLNQHNWNMMHRITKHTRLFYTCFMSDNRIHTLFNAGEKTAKELYQFPGKIFNLDGFPAQINNYYNYVRREM